MASSSSSASSSKMTADALASSFAGLIISASGNIPGKRHDQIKRMVQVCGAKYEDQNISDCTHLITTPRHINTQKVREARSQQGCEIVSIDWLIRSLENLEPIDTKEFLLDFPSLVPPKTGTTTESAQAGKKRKFDDELRSEDGPSKKPKDITPAEFSKWAAIVEEEFRVKDKRTMVWIDHEGVWDATLGKESLSTSGNFDTSIYRIQLLFNVEKKTYYTHIRRDQCESKKRCDREGEGDLQSAQVAFRNCFEEATGLPWNFRDNDPHERRYIFVACRYEDGAGDGSSQAQQSETASSALVLKPSVRNVLEMLFDPKQKSEIQNLIATLSTGRLKVNRTAVTEHTVRVGTALLDELCKLPCNSRGEVKGGHGKLAERLKRCYWGLMFTNANSEPTDTTWIQQEREALCFLRNLIWLQAVLKGTSKLVGQELLLTAHQQLRFPEMTPLKKDTEEYKLLAKYFRESISPRHPTGAVRAGQAPPKVVSIFRVERAGEADRLDRWTKVNKATAGQRRLLWHGSPLHNFIGILSQGLRINAYRTDTLRMYDVGIYFSDMAGKSVFFCRAGSGTTALVLLCEVEVGHTMLSYSQAYYNAGKSIKESGSCAVFAQGVTTHNQWCDAKCVHPDLKGIWMPDLSAGKTDKYASTALGHNEYVVYDPAQVRQRYLFQISIN